MLGDGVSQAVTRPLMISVRWLTGGEWGGDGGVQQILKLTVIATCGVCCECTTSSCLQFYLRLPSP